MTHVLHPRPTRRTDGASLQTQSSKSDFGAYTIERTVAESASSIVYRAGHQWLPRVGVLKVARAHGERARERMVRVAQLANRHRGPSCVAVFDVGVLDDGRPYLAMEWVEGETLATAVTRRGPFAYAETLSLVEDLGAALAELHRDGVGHGSLDSSHVMLSCDGGWPDVKLLNLGSDAASPAADIVQLGALVAHLTGADREVAVVAPLRATLARCAAGAYDNIGAALRDLRGALAEERPQPPRWMAAVGLHVELRLDSADADGLSTLADALAVARATLVGGELEIAIERPNALLGVRALAAGRDGVLDTARLLNERLSSECLPGVHARLALHEADVLVRPRGERVDYVGGELLSLGKWPPSSLLTTTL